MLDFNGDEKASITANENLPLFVLAKGKTKRVETSQLEHLDQPQIDHSFRG
jgi:hypothetical protein